MFIRKDGSVRVIDNGRGIPVDINQQEQKSTVEVVMTVLHAGGKFGGGGYAVSGGLHGVGISVVNALSSHFEVEVRRQGHVWRQTFATGVPGGPAGQGRGDRRDRHDRHVLGRPDIFETVDFDFETLRQPASSRWPSSTRVCASRSPTSDERGEEDVTESYMYERGLVDYVEYLNGQERDLIHPDVIDFEAEDTEKGISAEVAMQWNDGYTESVYTFANTINTHEGGTHEEGFRAALTTRLINKYAREKNLLKEKDDNLTGDDIREGLTAVVSVKVPEPQFEGQTKTKLGNTEAKTFVQKVVGDRLGDWFDRNPAQAKNVIRKAIDAATARLAARKAREQTRRKGLLESAAACPASSATARRRTPRSARSSSSRATRPAARRSRAATGVPGDPAAARQDPQRREGPVGPGAGQQRGPGDDLRVRHRHRRGLLGREGCGTTRSC